MVALASLALSCNPHKAFVPSGEKTVPILAWYSLTSDQLTLENFRDLADAGINISFSTFRDSASVMKSLDLAQEVGIKALVCGAFDEDNKLVEYYKDHPALYGYSIQDEPNASRFPLLAAMAEEVRTKDPAHMPYINLFPTYASTELLGSPSYEEYVRALCETVDIDYISFDHYPFVTNDENPDHTYLREDFFENLEIISRVAKEYHRKFYAFSLSCNHYSYWLTNAGTMRMQAWCDFAYGCQFLQYFTYAFPPDDGFRYSVLDADSQKTHLYYEMKELNADIQGLADVIVGSDVHSVKRMAEGDERGFLASYFTTDGTDYLMIVNLDWSKEATIDLAEAGDAEVSVGDAIRRSAARGSRLFVHDPASPSGFALERCPSTLTISAGDMALIRL